jgi:twinkle protein
MTPQELNQRLSGMVETVAAHLLPNGRKEGRNWCVGSIHGEPGQSLRVCLEGSKAGVWKDFSDNAKGGDMLELWQQVRGTSFVDTLKEAKAFAGIAEDAPRLFAPGRKKRKPVAKPQCTKPQNYVMRWFEDRGIFQKSLDAYRVGQQGNTIVFPFLSPSGELELIKYRDLDSEEPDGKKKIWSNADPDYHLWGWQALDDNNRHVIICEGEIDALSWHQQGIPALSVPQGGGDGAKQTVWLDNDYDRLERFETIYVSMDMDAPGQAAIQPIITRLGVERCRIVNLGEHKDANEAHINGEILKRYLDSARTQDPAELKRLADHHEEIMDEFKNSDIIGLKLPWRKTHNNIRLRPAEISVWAGINGHGKSIALNHVCVEAVARGERVCIASMEMKPRKLGRKMYQQIVGHDHPSPKEAEAASRFLGNQVWLFEAHGTTKASRILEVFRYARKRYGITQFVVDSLAKCGFGEDDYNGQKAFVDQLMEFAGEHEVHVNLVVHVRKPGDESKVPGKLDVKGSGAITDMVDNVFIWWRNKSKEEAVGPGVVRNDADAVLNCVKQRETGIEPMVGLFFHPGSCQFTENAGGAPKQYIFT